MRENSQRTYLQRGLKKSFPEQVKSRTNQPCKESTEHSRLMKRRTSTKALRWERIQGFLEGFVSGYEALTYLGA
jgi:hypothetical protein